MLNHHGNRSVQVVYRGIFHHRRRARKQYTGIGGVSLPERIPLHDDLGMAAVTGVFIFMVTMVLSLIQMKITRSGEV